MSTSTQSPHNFKPLYEFTVNVMREFEKTETREENGASVTTKTKVKEPTPLFLCFKKPSRAEREDADTYRAAQWNRYLEKGLMPEAILSRDYANRGGVMDDGQKAQYHQLRSKLLDRMEEYQRLTALKDEGAAAVRDEIMILRDEVIRMEREQNVFFANTAEAKARDRLTEYLVLNHSYTREAPDKPWVPLFKGDSLDARLTDIESREDSAEEVYALSKDRLWFIAALYVSLGGDVSKKDIEAFEEQLTAESDDATTPAAATVVAPPATDA